MIQSIPDVCEVTHRGGPPAVLLEVPHGATRREHYDRLRSQLRGALPEGLEDFFFLNTDSGAPEVALAVAEGLAAAGVGAVVLRALVPRTFIDLNRVIDVDPSLYKEGGVTPGVPPYVQDPADLRLLRGLHAAYQDLAIQAFAQVCGAGGLAMMLHTYAPRSVEVAVDDRIVESLRAAYAPGAADKWPLRPEIDLIHQDPDGASRAAPALVAAADARLSEAGFAVAHSGTYTMHPATAAYHFAARYPRQTLCLEIRRDLLAERFPGAPGAALPVPIEEARISPEKAARAAGPLTRALLDALAAR